MKSVGLLTLFLAVFVTNLAFAASNEEEPKEQKAPAKEIKKGEIDDILDTIGYPELQVVPRASDRLAIEARSESSGWMVEHWTFELSGLATLAVGLTSAGNQRTGLNAAQKNEANTIGTVTSAVGLGWIAGGVLLGADRPYRGGLNTIAKYSGKDERSTLMRERMSEEALEQPAKVVRVLQYFAVVTNFTMNGLAMIYANNGGRINAGVGMTMAFLPWIFQDHSLDVYEKQLEYKKKIYAPIKSASFSYDPYHKTVTPMSNLTWSF